MGRVVLESLGCKLNQAEIEGLAGRLVDRGHAVVDLVTEADVYVLNTCTVTHVADRKSRQALRAARRANPRVRIVTAGCYARRAPRDLEQLGVVDAILDNVEDGSVVGAIEIDGRVRTCAPIGDNTTGWSRTRSLVKIQEGCSDSCSFCVVPRTRGPGRSRTADDVVAEVDARVAAGHKEVVLTGTKLGDYRGNGCELVGLRELIRRVLAETRVERLRLSSLQPSDLTSEMLALWQDERLCPHLHLPLQSGSDAILHRMHRPYTLAEYEAAVRRAGEAIPDLSVTTDLLVGYPGESESDFEDSCRFCEGMGFAAIHVFQYSRRPDTAAATMPDQVDERVKKRRSSRIMALAGRSGQRFRSRFLGRTMRVLWEDLSDNGLWSGHTANHLLVHTRTEQRLAGKMLAARIAEECSDALRGELVNGGYDG